MNDDKICSDAVSLAAQAVRMNISQYCAEIEELDYRKNPHRLSILVEKLRSVISDYSHLRQFCAPSSDIEMIANRASITTDEQDPQEIATTIRRIFKLGLETQNVVDAIHDTSPDMRIDVRGRFASLWINGVRAQGVKEVNLNVRGGDEGDALIKITADPKRFAESLKIKNP